MKKNVPYSRNDEEDDSVLTAKEPVAAYAVEAVATPDNVAYANIVETIAAMQETLSGKYAGVIDTSSTKSFISSILGDEDD